jgi:hypothetical protein
MSAKAWHTAAMPVTNAAHLFHFACSATVAKKSISSTVVGSPDSRAAASPQTEIRIFDAPNQSTAEVNAEAAAIPLNTALWEIMHGTLALEKRKIN